MDLETRIVQYSGVIEMAVIREALTVVLGRLEEVKEIIGIRLDHTTLLTILCS